MEDKMIFCVDCGAENDSSARFCVNCGAELFFPEETVAVQPVVPEQKKKSRKTKGKISEPVPEPLTGDPAVPSDGQVKEQNPEVEAEIETVTEADTEEAVPVMPRQTAVEYIPPVIPSDRQYSRQSQPAAYTGNQYTSRERYTARYNAEERPVAEIPAKMKPLSTTAYFWLIFLYAVPGLGLLMSIILSLIPSNLNLKRFSRASLIFQLVCIILLLIIFLVLVILWQHIDYTQYIYPTEINWSIKIR